MKLLQWQIAVVVTWNTDSGSTRTLRNGLPSVVLHVLYTCISYYFYI
jgi:hypothetical protein